MALYETDLSPAWLLKVASAKVTLFKDLSQVGLGSPTFVALPTADGVKVFPAGTAIDAGAMSAPWILAWFAGSSGWTLWDVPTLIVLQHKPKSIACEADGMTLSFAGQCDYLAYMPLYGFFRPPQQGQEVLSKQGLPKRGIQTWTWSAGLPKEVAALCSWWAGALRKYPIDCEETFNVDPAGGSITVREKFSYITIDDDWKTPPIWTAPISPTVGFTQTCKGFFPITLSAPAKDPDCMTPYGPYMVVEGADTYTYTVADVVNYVNQTEIQSPPDVTNPGVAKAAALASEMLARRFVAGPMFMVEFDRKSFVWAQLAENVFPKGLAYTDAQSQRGSRGRTRITTTRSSSARA